MTETLSQDSMMPSETPWVYEFPPAVSGRERQPAMGLELAERRALPLGRSPAYMSCFVEPAHSRGGQPRSTPQVRTGIPRGQVLCSGCSASGESGLMGYGSAAYNVRHAHTLSVLSSKTWFRRTYQAGRSARLGRTPPCRVSSDLCWGSK